MSESRALPPALDRHVDHVCDCFECAWRAWQSGERPRVADFLGTTREPERSVLLRELIQLELHYRNARGERWRVDEFRERFPELDAVWLAGLARSSTASGPEASSAETAVYQPGPTAAAPPAPVAGPAFPGYELLETVRSGLAVVYKARQVRPQRLVALKTMLHRPGAMPGDLQRFLHAEAEHVAQLDHPHIVPIYEVGVTDGSPYFSMKWVDGGSLAQAVAGGRWPVAGKELARRAAQLMAKVARAVHYAHQRGILHRDLKPANILLDPDGQPYVSDFGLARSLGDSSLSPSGEIVGTPAYMAPEQANGGKELTTAADVYGLGAVLYELLTGRPPFRAAGSIADMLRQVTEREPEPPRVLNPAAPADLGAICLKCLQKEPEDRYNSAEALAEDLDRWLAGEPIRARPSGRLERVVKWARRRPAAAALAGLSLAVVVLVFGLVVWQWRTAVAAQKAEQEQKKLARVNDAALLTLTVSEAQQLYSAELVDRVKDRGVEVSDDYTLRQGTIPLPPTLTMILAQRISQENAGTVRLYSDWPFPARKDRPPLDRFEQEALRALRHRPEEPFYRSEDWQGRPSLRYASAQIMQKRCVECHNTHKDSPKKDWKEGDVRGVLEVILPLE
jgi:serine/threonine-protein kinase